MRADQPETFEVGQLPDLFFCQNARGNRLFATFAQPARCPTSSADFPNPLPLPSFYLSLFLGWVGWVSRAEVRLQLGFELPNLLARLGRGWAEVGQALRAYPDPISQPAMHPPRRPYWVTVRIAEGRTADHRILARGHWAAWWLGCQLWSRQNVLMVRKVR